MSTDAQAPAEPTAIVPAETETPAAPPADAVAAIEETRDHDARITALTEANARLSAKLEKASGSMTELERLQARVAEVEQTAADAQRALALEQALNSARDAGITDPDVARVFAHGLMATKDAEVKASATAKAKEQFSARQKMPPTSLPATNGGQQLTSKQRALLAFQQADRGVYTGSS